MPAEKRRALILDALDAEFHENGCISTTMESVARRAGMSKRTVYAQFSDRHALFCAYMERVRTSIIRPLPPEDLDLPLADRLRRLLGPRDHGVRDDLVLALLRATLTEGLSESVTGPNFWLDGKAKILSLIKSELDRGVDRGEIRISDTTEAANLLKDMAFINPIDLLLNADWTPGLAERQRRFDTALRVFLRGIEES